MNKLGKLNIPKYIREKYIYIKCTEIPINTD